MSKKRVKVTIKDVAKHADVSITTISNYLNKRYGNMATETRQIIENSIKDLGYYPSLGASALPRNRKTKTVAIVIPHNIDYTFHHPYFAEVMRGLSLTLEKNRYRAMILVGGDRSEADLYYLNVISKGIVDGFIFFDINNKDIYIRELSTNEIPIMVVGRNPNGETNYVDANIVDGAYRGTQYLIAKGNRDILLISGPETLVFSEQTIEGYKQALKEVNIPFDKRMIKFGEFSFDFGYEVGKSLLSSDSQSLPAIYSASGQTTLGFMKAVKEFDVENPQELSIVSFGEHPLVRSLYPWLSFLKQPEVIIGCEIGNKLIDMITNEKHECEPKIFPVDLIV
jgi:LacI family transcriptional regulator, galactose operon repressor